VPHPERLYRQSGRRFGGGLVWSAGGFLAASPDEPVFAKRTAQGAARRRPEQGRVRALPYRPYSVVGVPSPPVVPHTPLRDRVLLLEQTGGHENEQGSSQRPRQVRKIVGNKKMESKGKIQKAAGDIQTSYGDLKDDLKKGV
jgi:hypothetical protein